jgi:hypothetical protein
MSGNDPVLGWWNRQLKRRPWLALAGGALTLLLLVGAVTGNLNEIMDFFARFRHEEPVQKFDFKQIYVPPRQPPEAKAQPVPGPNPTLVQRPAAPRVSPESECRYLWVAAYPNPAPREFRAHARLEDFEFDLDDGDVLRPRLYVFKGYQSGRAYRVEFVYTESDSKAPEKRRYVGDLTFGASIYYRMDWPPLPQTHPPSAGVLKPYAIPESHLKELIAKRHLDFPECAGVQRGIAITY